MGEMRDSTPSLFPNRLEYEKQASVLSLTLLMQLVNSMDQYAIDI